MSYPDEQNLTTKATLKTWLDPQITGTASDVMLDALINGVSAAIIEEANLTTIFNNGNDMTEVRNGNGQNKLVTKVRPIASITSLTIVDQTGGYLGYNYSQPQVIPASVNSAAGYLFDDTTIYLLGYRFTRGFQNVTLVYKGGYATGSGVQRALEQACLITCAMWWKRRKNIGDISIAQPQGMGTMMFSQADFPAEVLTIIGNIKRIAPTAP